MSDTVVLQMHGRVAVLTLNRPEALNALNAELLGQMKSHFEDLSHNPDVGCIVVTGSEKAFAAGADIKEMSGKTHIEMLMSDFFGRYNAMASSQIPTIAAVSGFALGGGCELAMMTRAIGKAKAMDMILTGRMMDAEEAERSGLVARVIPAAELMAETMKAATTIANYSRPSVVTAKQAVNRAFETTLAEGLHYEQRVFYALFATQDQKEGMAAFSEKRKPDFKHK